MVIFLVPAINLQFFVSVRVALFVHARKESVIVQCDGGIASQNPLASGGGNMQRVR